MAFFKTNDGVDIHYHTYGKQENQAIILISGYSASEVTWICQIEALMNAGFFVITYDHRAHGRSQKVNYGLSLSRLAMDLHQLIEHLKLENPVLLGHSMGAATIMAYEELFTDRAILLVITEDQGPTFLKHPDWLDGKEGRSFHELEGFMLEFPRMKLTEKHLSDDLKRELGKKMYPFNFKTYQELLFNVIVQDWRSTIAQESKPHLFLSGGKSPIFSPASAKAARALSHHPASQWIEFEGCGHILHLEDADKFNQTVINFIHENQKN